MLLVLASGLCVAPAATATPPTPPPTQVIRDYCPDGSGALACASPTVIYMAPELRGREWIRAWRHERGHQADWAFLDDYERGYFAGLVRMPGPWRGVNDAEHVLLVTPAETFADAYVTCRTGVRTRSWFRNGQGVSDPPPSGYEPSPRLYRRVCRWMERIAD